MAKIPNEDCIHLLRRVIANLYIIVSVHEISCYIVLAKLLCSNYLPVVF